MIILVAIAGILVILQYQSGGPPPDAVVGFITWAAGPGAVVPVIVLATALLAMAGPVAARVACRRAEMSPEDSVEAAFARLRRFRRRTLGVKLLVFASFAAVTFGLGFPWVVSRITTQVGSRCSSCPSPCCPWWRASWACGGPSTRWTSR
jgi:hypothetical protein